MQKIVLFIEPNADNTFKTPSKIGNLFMNRFAIEENANCEILNICELEIDYYVFKKRLGFFYSEKGEGLNLKFFVIVIQVSMIQYNFDRSEKDRLREQQNFLSAISNEVKLIPNFGSNHLMPHFIFCTARLYTSTRDKNIQKLFQNIMRKHGIQSSLFTVLSMERKNLITKEKQKQAYEGKLKDEPYWEGQEASINDDLESFFNAIENQEEIDEEEVWSFFTPKLRRVSKLMD